MVPTMKMSYLLAIIAKCVDLIVSVDEGLRNKVEVLVDMCVTMCILQREHRLNIHIYLPSCINYKSHAKNF